MAGNFLFGQYKPSKSFGHRLDPRGKLMFAIFLMLICLFTSSAYYYLLIILGLIGLLLVSDITLLVMLRNMKPFIILVSFTALYHLLFSARDTTAIIRIFGFRLTEGGLQMAASFSLRLLVFVGIAFFVSLTTMPSDLAEALVGWMKPLKKIGIPVTDISLIIFIALRFIPVLAEEFDTIRKAQLIRGVDFTGGLIKKVKKMIFLLIPVFQAALRRADDLAIAIESRGYISGADRSSFSRLRWRVADFCFILSATAISVVLFIIVRA